MKRNLLELGVLAAVMAVSAHAAPQAGTVKDPRDGQTYRTIQVNNQDWMVENLNYQMKDSYCYGDDPANCRQHGCLYTWEAAMGACPSGWHVPTDEEWKGLVESQKGWQNLARAGILLPMAGDRRADGVYHYLGESAFFWSATPSGKKFFRYKFTAGTPKHDRAPMVDGPAYSVKCVSGAKTCQMPLMKAVKSGNVAKVESLLKSGMASVNEGCYTLQPGEMTSVGEDYEDISPLGMAIDKGNLGMVKLLLNYGANPNATDMSGPSEEAHSMLTRAMGKANLAIVKLLLEKGAKISYCDVALGSSAKEDILLYMLEKMDPKDYNRCWGGMTLLDFFKQSPKVFNMLKKRGAIPGEGYCSDMETDSERGIFEYCGD